MVISETLRCIPRPALAVKLFLLRSRLSPAVRAGAVSRPPDREASAAQPERTHSPFHQLRLLLSLLTFRTAPTENHRVEATPADQAEFGPTLTPGENTQRSSVHLRE